MRIAMPEDYAGGVPVPFLSTQSPHPGATVPNTAPAPDPLPHKGFRWAAKWASI